MLHNISSRYRTEIFFSFEIVSFIQKYEMAFEFFSIEAQKMSLWSLRICEVKKEDIFMKNYWFTLNRGNRQQYIFPTQK